MADIQSILFVCLGNICRSSTAEGVFRKMAQTHGLNLEIASAGTGGYHNGELPDRRAMATASIRGYDLSEQRSSQLQINDFDRFDLILCMDHSNFENTHALASNKGHAKIKMFLDYAPNQHLKEVPDPYYEDNFDEVLDLIEEACSGLVSSLKNNF